jgi:hypothetical protein
MIVLLRLAAERPCAGEKMRSNGLMIAGVAVEIFDERGVPR